MGKLNDLISKFVVACTQFLLYTFSIVLIALIITAVIGSIAVVVSSVMYSFSLLLYKADITSGALDPMLVIDVSLGIGILLFVVSIITKVRGKIRKERLYAMLKDDIKKAEEEQQKNNKKSKCKKVKNYAEGSTNE